jgi:hypothetical protein
MLANALEVLALHVFILSLHLPASSEAVALPSQSASAALRFFALLAH